MYSVWVLLRNCAKKPSFTEKISSERSVIGLYRVRLPRAETAVSPANMQHPLRRFGDVAGDGVHVPIAVPTDTARIAVVVPKNVLHRFDGNLAPPLLNQVADAIQSGTGVRQGVGLVVHKRRS